MKYCSHCRKYLAPKAFAKGTRNGLQDWCRICRSDYMRMKRVAANESKHGPTPPDGYRRCRVCKEVKEDSQFNKRGGKQHWLRRRWCKTCQRQYHRGYRITQSYGITNAEYEALLSKQNWVCVICHGPETMKLKDGTLQPLVVDHDHKTREIRGILCHSCNSGLGYFKDDCALLKRAISYLKPKRQKVKP